MHNTFSLWTPTHTRKSHGKCRPFVKENCPNFIWPCNFASTTKNNFEEFSQSFNCLRWNLQSNLPTDKQFQRRKKYEIFFSLWIFSSFLFSAQTEIHSAHSRPPPLKILFSLYTLPCAVEFSLSYRMVPSPIDVTIETIPSYGCLSVCKRFVLLSNFQTAHTNIEQRRCMRSTELRPTTTTHCRRRYSLLGRANRNTPSERIDGYLYPMRVPSTKRKHRKW